MYKMTFNKYINDEYYKRLNFKIDFDLNGLTDYEKLTECILYYCECMYYNIEIENNKFYITNFVGVEIELKNIEIKEV